MKKSTIEFTQGQLDDLYLSLQNAIHYFDTYGHGEVFEKDKMVLKSFMMKCHEKSMALDEE